jgi:hypothetical protein
MTIGSGLKIALGIVCFTIGGVFNRGDLHRALCFMVRCRYPRNVWGVRDHISFVCFSVVTPAALAQ